jgi:uncharacterized membrane protein YeaQ/YmgE (transglycosylase-associated protein family)
VPIILLVLLVLIAVIVVGWFIVGLAFQLIWYAIIGLVIGALARLVLPGSQPIGWLMTILAGIGGALGGGLIANAIGAGGIVRFLLAIVIAAALIGLVIAPRRKAAF